MKIYATLLFFVSCMSCCFGDGNRAGISWGTVSNGLQIGVSAQTIFTAGDGAGRQTILYVRTTNASNYRILFCPPKSDVFQIRLHNSRSKEVQKTSLGRKFEVEPKETVALTDVSLEGPNRWKIEFVPEEWNVQIQYLNLVEHFKVIESGEYDLSVELRLYQKDEKGKLRLNKLTHSIRLHIDRPE